MSSSTSSSSSLVILISGANRGLGYSCIEELIHSHPTAHILLGTRSLENGTAAIAKLKQTHGDAANNVEALQLEVTNQQSINSAVEFISNKYQRLDILISNAGIARYTNTIKDITDVLSTNLYAPIHLHDSFLPLLKKSSSPFEVIVSSEVGCWVTHELKEQNKAKQNEEQNKFIKLIEEANDLSDEEILALSQSYLNREKSIQEGEKKELAGDKWPSNHKIYGAYGISKVLLNLYSRCIAKRNADWLTVAVVTPGYCATGLNAFSGPRTAKQGAESILTGLKISRAESGKGLVYDGKNTPFDWAPPEIHTDISEIVKKQ